MALKIRMTGSCVAAGWSEDEKRKHRDRKDPAKRGRIKGFSAGARKRLATFIASCEPMGLPVLLTLTLPGDFDSNPDTWKRYMRAFYQRMERRYPAVRWVERLEFQKRGAPHWHVAAWGLGEVTSQLHREVAGHWFEVVGSGDVRHLRAGTRVEEPRSAAAWVTYMCKEFAKGCQVLHAGAVQAMFPETSLGRWWTVRGKAKMTLEACREFTVDLDRWEEVADLLDDYGRSRGLKFMQRLGSYVGWSVLPRELLERCWRILGLGLVPTVSPA